MKKAPTLIVLCIIAACSYASLWYGFTKGYEYKLHQNLIESIYTSRSLSLIREGNIEKAVAELEGMLDQQIVERSATDGKFADYIVGMSESDINTTQKLEAQIIQYRKSTNYKCTTSKPACDAINEFIYGK